MAYNQTHFFEPDNAEFDMIVPADSYVEQTYACAHSPFVKKKWWKKAILKRKIALIRLAEYTLGTKLYAKDTLGPLKNVPAETLSLLSWLTTKGYIKDWKCNFLSPGYHDFAHFNLIPNPIITPEGRKFFQQGSLGNGIAQTVKEAVAPALGEFVERYSTSSAWWNRTDMVRGCVSELKKKRKQYVDPFMLRLWPVSESGTYGEKSVLQEHTTMRWISGYDAFTRKNTLVPASCIYTFFAKAYDDEPILRETNSNGAAAHTTLKNAEYRAICELVERDAFLQAWYQKKKVSVIAFDSIGEVLPKFKSVFSSLSKNTRVTVTVLDITSDIGVPVFCAVICNNTPKRYAVFVSTASDVNARVALEKTLLEMTASLHSIAPHMCKGRKKALLEKFNNGIIDGYNDRRAFWAQQESLTEIEWFTKQKRKATCEEAFRHYSHLNKKRGRGGAYDTLKLLLKEKNVGVVFVRLKNALTKRSGLKVVKAISPDLIPIFFNEQNRPLNVRRFTHMPDGIQAKLESTPHPFI